MKIAIDVDDVLAAFVPHTCNYFRLPLEKMDYWSVPDMAAKYGDGWFSSVIAKDPDFWETLPVLTNSEEIDFEICCYMSAFPSEHFHSRLNWLKRHGFPEKPLIHSFNKIHDCINLGIDVLIDDKPATIEALKSTPVKGIHFITSYAGFEPVGEYITSMKEVKGILQLV